MSRTVLFAFGPDKDEGGVDKVQFVKSICNMISLMGALMLCEAFGDSAEDPPVIALKKFVPFE